MADGYHVLRAKGVAEKYVHRQIVERVLGRALPGGAEIHHADGNKLNNANHNLVVCPNHGYHALLHHRMRAKAATGDPRKRRCSFCKNWDEPKTMWRYGQSERYAHRACKQTYESRQRERLTVTA